MADATYVRHALMPFKFFLLGGPPDGTIMESNLLPEVIDGDSYHFYGQNSYVITEVDYDNKYVKYEHIKVGAKMVEGEDSESDGIQPAYSDVDE